MGKFSKVAQGVMMVHSKGASVDFGFLAVARSAGAKKSLCRVNHPCKHGFAGRRMMQEKKIMIFSIRFVKLAAHSAIKGSQGWNRNGNGNYIR